MEKVKKSGRYYLRKYKEKCQKKLGSDLVKQPLRSSPSGPNMEKLLSLPGELQLEILSYLDLEAQMAAAEAFKYWAMLLLSNQCIQGPRRLVEPERRTGFSGLSLLLDSGRRNWYVKTKCAHGTLYTYFYLVSRGKALQTRKDGKRDIPDIDNGRDITNSPLLDDLIFPAREFIIKQPPRTNVTASGDIVLNKPVTVVKREPLCPFFVLFNPTGILPCSCCTWHHRLSDPRVLTWQEKLIKFSVYRKARVVDFVQVGVDMLWDLNRKGRLPSSRKDGIYQLFVEI
ncbi:hypothetical protein TWF730_003286 [Orbilia blumenaviensis]|uniref:F-box domain-containing protein n=1 Tax=Orbilia blumenaviensis TaxID=1796055 RepID=A0AAV9U9A0_9PEZI